MLEVTKAGTRGEYKFQFPAIRRRRGLQARPAHPQYRGSRVKTENWGRGNFTSRHSALDRATILFKASLQACNWLR